MLKLSAVVRVGLIALGSLLVAGPSLAVPVLIESANVSGNCDGLRNFAPGTALDELGPAVGGFPADEQIFVQNLGTSGASACPGRDTGAANVELRIRNRTGRGSIAGRSRPFKQPFPVFRFANICRNKRR